MLPDVPDIPYDPNPQPAAGAIVRVVGLDQQGQQYIVDENGWCTITIPKLEIGNEGEMPFIEMTYNDQMEIGDIPWNEEVEYITLSMYV